jgi:hypothetical protein
MVGSWGRGLGQQRPHLDSRELAQLASQSADAFDRGVHDQGDDVHPAFVIRKPESTDDLVSELSDQFIEFVNGRNMPFHDYGNCAEPLLHRTTPVNQMSS